MTGQAQGTGVGRRSSASEFHVRRVTLACELVARRALPCRDRRVDDLGLVKALVTTQASLAFRVGDLRVDLPGRWLPGLFRLLGRGRLRRRESLAAREQGNRSGRREGEREREQIA
jgi:hypothetical protein